MPDNTYDLILIQIGANDVTRFTSKRNISAALVVVLDYAQSHASSTVVLTAGNIGLSPVFNFPLSALVTSRTNMVKHLFQEEIATRQSVTYVDLFKGSVDDVFSGDPKTYYAEDSFHPSSEGYNVWYQEIQAVLRKS